MIGKLSFVTEEINVFPGTLYLCKSNLDDAHLGLKQFEKPTRLATDLLMRDDRVK